jgi:hypothetical protein
MWSVSQASAGRRDGRVDRKRRRSFNIPIVRAKFTSVASYIQAADLSAVSGVTSPVMSS